MRVGKKVFGAKGLDKKNSPFLMDPLRAVECENIRVTDNTRKRRPGKERFLYTKHSSNAMRFKGKDHNSFLIAIDKTNTEFNTANDFAIEFRIRLPDPLGFGADDPLYIISRPVYVSGVLRYAFAISLTQTVASTATTENYDLTLEFHDSGGTLYTFTTTNSNMQVSVGGGWYNIHIRKLDTETQAHFHNGANSESITVASSDTSMIQGSFADGEDEKNHCDIVVGAKCDLSEGYNFDIDEIRLWDSNRTNTNFSDYRGIDLPDSEVSDNSLLLYLNFEETDADEYHCINKANTDTPVFLGASIPYYDSSDGTMVYPSNNGYGQLKAYDSSFTGTPTIGFACNHTFHKTTEIAIIPLKAKHGRIFEYSTTNANSYLELDDNGAGAMIVRLGFDDGSAQTITGSVTLDSSKFDGSTPLYIGITQDSGTNTVTLYVNGTSAGSYVHTGSIVGANITTLGGKIFSGNITYALPMKLKWIRSWADTKSSTFMTSSYNTDIEDLATITYHHYVASIQRSTASVASLLGTGTNWSTRLADAILAYKFNSKLAKGSVATENIGHNIIDIIDTLAATSANTGMPDQGVGVTGSDYLQYKTDTIISTLVFCYNEKSFKTAYYDDENRPWYRNNNYILESDQGEEGVGITGKPEICLSIEVEGNFANVPSLYRQNHPSYIGGTTEISGKHLKKVRYLGEIRDREGYVDSIVVIVGSSLITVGKSDQSVTYHPINIFPNNDAFFTAAYLDRQLYLTDGKNKIHIYTYRGQVRVRRWGWENILHASRDSTYATGGTSGGSHTAYPSGATYNYKIAYYNREVDQYSGMSANPRTYTAASPAITDSWIRVDGWETAESDFEFGATDVVWLRTLDLNDTGVEGEYYILDYTPIRSTGYVDWSGDDDSLLPTLFPSDRVGIDFSPPNGSIVVEHEGRLFLLGEEAKDKVFFNTIDARLHAGKPKSETYHWRPDDFFEIGEQKNLTAAISFAGVLWIFSMDTIHVLEGRSKASFRTRKLHNGIGCVSPRTLINVGGSLVWLGLDDIYMSQGSFPQKVDQEGRIHKFLRDRVDLTRSDEAFAVYNREEQVIEFHMIGNNTTASQDEWVCLTYDLISKEHTLDTDAYATCGKEIVESDTRSIVYYGHMGGFIVKHDKDAITEYAPSSGTVAGTVTGYTLSTGVLDASGATFNTTDAGLSGCSVYIIYNRASDTWKGHVLRFYIYSNDATSLTLGLGYLAFGDNNFAPANGDLFVICAPMWRFRTALLAGGGESGVALPAQELVDVEYYHETSNANATSHMIMKRDSDSSRRTALALGDLDKYRSKVYMRDSGRAQFFDLDLCFNHESADFELVGMVLGVNESRGGHKYD